MRTMLAYPWEPGEDPAGWWLSEKLDGVRCHWDGRQFVSRHGKVFDAPDWFKDGMPAGALDGELWLGHGRFNELLSRLRTGNWTGIEFHVFDAPAVAVPFEQRQGMLDDLSPALPDHVFVVPQTRCTGAAHLDREFREALARGGEGLVLRRAGSLWFGGRSKHYRKLKPAGGERPDGDRSYE